MGFRKQKPTSDGIRHATFPDFAEITKARPEKKLTEFLHQRAGRNNVGRMTVRHRGGGHKRLYRMVDFKRKKFDVVGTVKAIEYDPNRNCRIALVTYADGEKSYILAAKDLGVGSQVLSSQGAIEPKTGYTMPLKHIPQGLEVHNVEMHAGKGGQIARAAGSFVRLMAIDGEYAIVLLPSGELRKIHKECRATIGQIGNAEFNLRNYGKAGRMRWLGRRPHVRGNAMNPVAHPHGGGEGHTNGGRQHCSPTAVLAKGFKTRSKSNPTGKFIIRRRNQK